MAIDAIQGFVGLADHNRRLPITRCSPWKEFLERQDDLYNYRLS